MMISYPLREYISSKKDDDYYRSSLSTDDSSSSSSSQRTCYLSIIVVVVLLLVVAAIYLQSSSVDPTCFQRECTLFVCQAYADGLIGGRLCPDLCTSQTVQLGNCLGEHRHFRSRLFEENEGNEVIRCYLKYPLSQSNPSADVKKHFNSPPDDSTLEEFTRTLREHIENLLDLDHPDEFVEKLLTFADFNQDSKISLSEARSLWSLVQLDEFVYNFVLGEKSYTPKIHRTCGHLFSVERVVHPSLPFAGMGNELLSDRPNWYQRVRLAIGIVEFHLDTSHFQESNEQLYLCHSLRQSFGFDKDYEAKLVKVNHLISSKSLLKSLPSSCQSSKECSLDVRCPSVCNQTAKRCELPPLQFESLFELCSLVKGLLLPDGNATFVDPFVVLLDQCEEIRVNPGEMRRTIFLENLRNLLWTHVEYQMGKITKKSTKRPAAQHVK